MQIHKVLTEEAANNVKAEQTPPRSFLPGEPCNVATCPGLQDSAKAKYFGFICPSCSARAWLRVLTFLSLPLVSSVLG